MKKIAYFAHTGNISGPNNSMLQLLRFLDRSQYDPVVYSLSGGPCVEQFRSLGVRCHIVPVSTIQPSMGIRRTPLYLDDLFRKTLMLCRSLRREQVDLVHINTTVTPYPALAALFLKIPVVLHVRESLKRTIVNNLYLNFMATIARTVVAVSKNVQQQMLSRTRLKDDKICVIHNGIDLGPFKSIPSPGTERILLGLPSDKKIIALPAFLLPHKGHEIMLEAVSLLIHKFSIKNICLLMIGQEPEAGNGKFTGVLKSYCRKNNLNEYVRFMGLRHDVPILLSLSDIVCLPATYDDPLPRSVLEGMAAGKPVVGSAVGGIPEMIDDQRTGLLVPPGRSDLLSRALADLLNDEDKAIQMGQAGRRRVEKEFTGEIHAEQIQALYQYLASK